MVLAGKKELRFIPERLWDSKKSGMLYFPYPLYEYWAVGTISNYFLGFFVVGSAFGFIFLNTLSSASSDWSHSGSLAACLNRSSCEFFFLSDISPNLKLYIKTDKKYTGRCMPHILNTAFQGW